MPGQAQCRVCNVWVVAKGARLKDGSIATAGSVGWYCRCCQYKLRSIQRSIRYTPRLRSTGRIATDPEVGSTPSVDLSYFNRLRAELLQRLAAALPESRDLLGRSGGEYLPVDVIQDLRQEFGDIGGLLDLAYDIDPPNKISMVVEFERVKSNLDRVPTKNEFEKISPLEIVSYDIEFGSWENFLDKLGHDPWYRRRDVTGEAGEQGRQLGGLAEEDHSSKVINYDNQSVYDNVATLRENIRGVLEYDPAALKIFEMMEADIGDVDPVTLRRLADEVAPD